MKTLLILAALTAGITTTAALAQSDAMPMTHDAMPMAEGAAHTTAEAVTLGDLTIAGAFARATLPNAPVAGGFLTVTNNGTADDTLVSASAPIAGMTQVHEMAMDGDVMRMRELPDGLPIPAGETVTLEPGGYHLMFMDLTGPLTEGETVPVTLTFAQAGTVEVMLPVGPAIAKMSQ